ncbi:circularly permuted type 2 ATP-grasp protein [Candidatus Poriferisodalis sp.]|uniref:circularly permuted type 2 ATP-grasp protein n=1 Tax=Candidatus Poriferisodalis sp. TaxID=3101277 RepID=UPI003C6F6C40
MIAAAEWREIERGLAQRVTALNRFLADVYTGEGAAMADDKAIHPYVTDLIR